MERRNCVDYFWLLQTTYIICIVHTVVSEIVIARSPKLLVVNGVRPYMTILHTFFGRDDAFSIHIHITKYI